jgi:Caspase domain
MSKGRRYAVLIGSSRFDKEPHLSPLKCPENDVDGMREILAETELGAFEEPFVFKNAESYAVMHRIEEILSEVTGDDQLLIYYSGHGKMDLPGRLYLTTTNTEVKKLVTTSIPIETLRLLIGNSSCRKIMLILDCCYGGAAGRSFMNIKGSIDDNLQELARGNGVYILTASTASQTAQEREGDDYGLLTKHIISGIKQGDADVNDDGYVSMDDLYSYVFAKVKSEGYQEPMRWALNVKGEDMIVARAMRTFSAERLKIFKEMILRIENDLDEDVFEQAYRVIRENQPKRDKEQFALLEGLCEGRLSIGRFNGSWIKLSIATMPQMDPESVIKPSPLSTELERSFITAGRKSAPAPSINYGHLPSDTKPPIDIPAEKKGSRKGTYILFGLLVLAMVGSVIGFRSFLKQKGESGTLQKGSENVVEKNNVPVYVAFTLLVECCLPNGTRLTSGFRAAGDQLSVIRHYAQVEGIQVPANMRVEKPESWRPVLAQLRNKGYFIADPDKSPHSSDDLIVFDLTGLKHDAIEAAVRKAEKEKGLVKIERIIREGPTQAVHVEFSLTQRGLQELSLGQSDAGPNDDKKESMRRLLDLHDQAKGNPTRQIALDNLMIDILDPTDLSAQGRLQEEIKTHEQELDKIAQDNTKKTILNQINTAERDGDLKKALKITKDGSVQFSEFQGLASRFEALLKIGIAKDIFFARNCEDAEIARENLAQARQLDPSNQLASMLEKEIDSWASRCSSVTYFWIAFALLAMTGLLFGLYFLLRRRYWELKRGTDQ